MDRRSLHRLLLAGGRLDHPALAEVPFAIEVAAPTIGMIQIFILIGVVYWLTRKRVIRHGVCPRC
jgi:hypothetical protein